MDGGRDLIGGGKEFGVARVPLSLSGILRSQVVHVTC